MLHRPLIDPVQKPSAAVPRPLPQPPLTRRRPRGVLGLAAFTLLLGICFGKPLFDLVQFARHSELYSHALLIPFISAYLIRLKRRDLKLDGKQASRWALLPLVVGATLLSPYCFCLPSGFTPIKTDSFPVFILAFLPFVLRAFLLLL